MIPNLPMLFLEEIVGKSHINIVKDKVRGLGNALEFFNKSGGIDIIGPFFFLTWESSDHQKWIFTLTKSSTPATSQTRTGDCFRSGSYRRSYRAE